MSSGFLWKSVIKHFIALLVAGSTLASGISFAAVSEEEEGEPVPPSLKTVPVPEPPNLYDFVLDKPEAIKLGKALFWDMQLGSDGIQACASCHFAAGADTRTVNQVAPNLQGDPPDTNFYVAPPNGKLTKNLFPFHQVMFPNHDSEVVRDSNNIGGPQGVRLSLFVDIAPGSAEDMTSPIDDPVFNSCGKNTRRTVPRNSPSVINAVFNYANFWDGRANNIFNGVNPFGPADADATVFADVSGAITPEAVFIRNASLASQAVGPPLSEMEMSARGRSFYKLGKKMLSLKPLGKQLVAKDDSVLGPLSMQWLQSCGKGLDTTYPDMIKAAFNPRYWDNEDEIITLDNGTPVVSDKPDRPLTTDEFSQMEANFSLFFGLAVQLYEATLVSDDSKYDRVQEGSAGFSRQEMEGLKVFMGEGRCINCHAGSEFTNASYTRAQFENNTSNDVIEFMVMGDDEWSLYDQGFYNIGLRPTAEDIGRGGTTPEFGGVSYPLSFSRLAALRELGELPFETPILPIGFPPDFRISVDGAFKTPSLRNVELTGPYFHNGSMSTLKQVVQFYVRGGNFAEENIADLDIDIQAIPGMQYLLYKQDALIAFLLTLTDQRVKYEKAPFDHPEICIPQGNKLYKLAAVGKDGNKAPLKPFLYLSPYKP